MMEFLYQAEVWLCLSFLIFCFIVFKYGKDAFLSILDKRIAEIKEELETSENLRVEAQELLAQYQRKHKNAVEESKELIAKAEKHAEQIRKCAEEDLAQTIERREKQMKERLVRMEESSKREIRKYAAQIAADATRQIIEENLDKKENEKLIDQSIGKISDHLH